MILPNIDVATATDEEVIAAYVAEGMTEDRARAYLAVIRDPDPAFPID